MARACRQNDDNNFYFASWRFNAHNSFWLSFVVGLLTECSPQYASPLCVALLYLPVFFSFPARQIIVLYHIFGMVSNSHRNESRVAMRLVSNENEHMNKHKTSTEMLYNGQIQPHIYALQIRFATFMKYAVVFSSFGFFSVCWNACTCLTSITNRHSRRKKSTAKHWIWEMPWDVPLAVFLVVSSAACNCIRCLNMATIRNVHCDKNNTNSDSSEFVCFLWCLLIFVCVNFIIQCFERCE